MPEQPEDDDDLVELEMPAEAADRLREMAEAEGLTPAEMLDRLVMDYVRRVVKGK